MLNFGKLASPFRIRARGAQWAPNLPASAATLPSAPTARYAAAYSTITASGGLVSQMNDIAGSAHATQAGADALKPLLMADGFGRPFIRFNGTQYMNVLSSLGYTSARNHAIFFVGRVHRHNEFECPIFSHGNVANASVSNTGGATLRCTAAFSATHHTPAISSGGIRGYSCATNKEYMVPGSQLQVIGISSRVTASGGTWMAVNRKAGLAPQNNVAGTAVTGAEIGRYANSPNVSGNWGTFDLYELVVYNTALTDVNALSVQTALADHYEILEVVNQIVLEGASTMQGSAGPDGTLSGDCPAMIGSDPKRGILPRDWRMVSRAISGNQVADLKARRDTDPDNIYNGGKLPGRNVVAITVGRNDMGSGGLTAAQHYTNVVDLVGHATDGILAQGWEVRVSHLPATSVSPQDKIDDFRALLELPAFKTDCNAGPGQLYDGKLGVIRQASVLDAGDTVFATTADANDLVYYQSDQTHLTKKGSEFLMHGAGKDPNGIMKNCLNQA